ncbi:MAG: YdeI/OmpD-associated family protein [Chitinophagaceae bacterium]
MNPKVDAYLNKASQWKDIMKQLQMIALDCGLDEDLKWGKPCYSYQQHNLIVIQGFKAYCALLFFKGVLLKDADKVLVKTGENTKVGRQLRFDNVKEVQKLERTIKAYIYEAIEIEKAGLKVSVEAKKAAVPKEFQDAMKKKPAVKKAFEALTPGRQRAYLIFFANAKQTATREARIEKCLPQIMKGKGLNE